MNSVGPSSNLVYGLFREAALVPDAFSPFPHSLTSLRFVRNTRKKIHRIDSLNQATPEHPYPACMFWFWGSLATNAIVSKL